jgi:hypothetical protein
VFDIAESQLIDIAFGPSNEILLASSGNGMFRSSDTGSTWEPIGPGSEGAFPTLTAFTTGAGGEIIAASDSAASWGIYGTVDGGNRWTKRYESQDGGRVAELLFDARSGILHAAVNDTSGGRIMTSADGGATWEIEWSTSYRITSLVRDRDGNILAGTSNGVFRKGATGTGIVRNVTTAENRIDVGIHPNPASTTMTVRVRGATAPAATICVRDLFGRPVLPTMSMELASGTGEGHMAVAGLAAGVYTCTVDVGGRSATKAFAIVR